MFFLGTQASAYAHGTFLDCGFVFDNLMLGLTSLGYGSCPQYSVIMYADLLKKHIPGTEDTLFIAGLPFGRPKAGSHTNEFQTSICRSTLGLKPSSDDQPAVSAAGVSFSAAGSGMRP